MRTLKLINFAVLPYPKSSEVGFDAPSKEAFAADIDVHVVTASMHVHLQGTAPARTVPIQHSAHSGPLINISEVEMCLPAGPDAAPYVC